MEQAEKKCGRESEIGCGNNVAEKVKQDAENVAEKMKQDAEKCAGLHWKSMGDMVSPKCRRSFFVSEKKR